MYDIITIGSSLTDSFIKSKEFDLHPNGISVQICLSYGSKIEVDEYLLRTGGGGGNTAVGFARMGFRTGVVTEIGKDILAKIILDDFKKEFVSTNLIISEKQENTGGSIILLGKDGGRTVMVHRGASSMLDPEDIPEEKISRAKWVHLSSIAGNIDTLQFIFKTLKKSETMFSWNPGKKELALISDGKINFEEVSCGVLFLNKEEWGLIKEQQETVLSSVKQIIITNGKKGGEVYVDGLINKKFVSSGASSVDDTGAGDAFAVGYLTAYLNDKSVSDCCEWGKRNAVSVIGKVGAKSGLLTIDKIEVHN
jgi:sugar/nucleoside kinase (ribokinase family)